MGGGESEKMPPPVSAGEQTTDLVDANRCLGSGPETCPQQRDGSGSGACQFRVGFLTLCSCSDSDKTLWPEGLAEPQTGGAWALEPSSQGLGIASRPVV